MKFVIYPHLKFSPLDGGISVQYVFAKNLKEKGFEVYISDNYGRPENPIFNDYISADVIDDSFIVVYCEGVLGNPLNAKKIVRWMLSELGQNVRYDYINTWSPKELVYFYGSETRFKNYPNFKNKIFKLLNFVHDYHDYECEQKTRNGICFSIRKMYNIHKKIYFNVTKGTEIPRDVSHENLKDIFLTHEIFISYDPITYLNVIAGMYGCVPIVVPIYGTSKENWLRKTHFWDFLEKNNLGTNLYGIAYGFEELDFAKSTLHLMKEQQKQINEFIKKRSLEIFISDMNNFEKCENTLKNVYQANISLIENPIEKIIYNDIDISTSFKEKIKNGCNFFKTPMMLPPKYYINDDYEVPAGDVIAIKRNDLFSLKTEKSILTGFSFEFDPQIVHQILFLKDSFWNYGMISQFDWFMKYYLHPHKHFVLSENNKLISYGIVKYHSGVYIIDSVIVDKTMRGKGYGKELITHIIKCYENQKICLICEINNIGFYSKFGFVSNENIDFIDKKLDHDKIVMTMNWNDSTSKISYYNDGLINNGILGGITMVWYNHLIFLVDYIKKNQCKKFVEIGVAKGGVLALAKLANLNMEIYGFDSWEGMPKLTEEDDQCHKQYEGIAWSSLQDVYNTFNLMNCPLTGVNLIKGYIENTLESNKNKLKDIDVLRLDVDWYAGTKLILDTLYENVIEGGLIIIDDYYYNKGCQKAVDDFRNKYNITSELYQNEGVKDLVYWFK